MSDMEKVIKGLECLAQKQAPTANPCKDCGYINRPSFAICVKDIASDALELLKEQAQMYYTLEYDWRMCRKLLKEHEEREKVICKGICDFIRGSCSTDTYEDKEYVCHVIQQMFIKGRSVKWE